jgi:hypothetical protein
MSALCLWCRAPEHSGNCDREALKEQIRLLRLQQAAVQKLPGEDVIWIQSLISHRNQKPRVDIQVGQIHKQMDAAAAIDVARNIFEVAAGAYADAFIFHFMAQKVGLDDGRAAQIIQEFRAYRDELLQEFAKDQQKPSSET